MPIEKHLSPIHDLYMTYINNSIMTRYTVTPTPSKLAWLETSLVEFAVLFLKYTTGVTSDRQVLRPGEEDDRDVIAALEASKRSSSRGEEDDPDTFAESNNSRLVRVIERCVPFHFGVFGCATFGRETCVYCSLIFISPCNIAIRLFCAIIRFKPTRICLMCVLHRCQDKHQCV